MKRTYEHSGAMGLAPFLLPAVGVPAVMLLGAVYVYAMIYSPLLILRLLVVAAYGFGLAMTMIFVGKAAKCRNTPVLALLGLAIGILALYSQWASFGGALLNKAAPEGVKQIPGYIDFLLKPAATWEFIKAVNESGWYSLKGSTVSGIALWILWGIEAVIVLGATTMGAIGSIADEVFCEDCGQWCEDQPNPMLTFPDGDEEFQRVVAGDLKTLEELQPPFEGQPAYMQLELKQCPECRMTSTYQVKVIKHGIDNEGKPTVETECITPQYLADGEGFKRLSSLVERPLGPPPTA